LPFLLSSPTNDPPMENTETSRQRKQIVQHAESPILDFEKKPSLKFRLAQTMCALPRLLARGVHPFA